MTAMLLQSAVEQGFIYALVALALYLSYRVLDIADLTTDGTFVLGSAVSAVVAAAGHPALGLVLAFAAGGAAGFVTAFLHTRMKVQAILAGIITMTGLYTINLWTMGNRADLPLLKVDTVFTWAAGVFGAQWNKLILAALITVGVGVLLALFLKTQLGLSIRATGDNRDMVSASSIDPAFTITVGLCIANGCTALSGGVLAQYQMSSSMSLGTGVVVIGLASLIIGEMFTRRGGVWRGVIAAIVGSIVYRVLMVFALRTSANPSNLKLISAVIVAVAISWPALSGWVRLTKRKLAARGKEEV
ncbi:MAG TPA: ABC transporter permease [Candidatus Fournierella merdigallinarum]|nr:ABC transporter permease [Candidatus Fournierella merdigallinarum]